jgi:hypothetical protein
VGEFDVSKAGSYHITVVPHPGEPPILTGVNVPYSAEFRDTQMNYGLLQNLASLTPRGGESAGVLVDVDFHPAQLDQILALDTFRHNLPRAVSVKDMWPLLLLIASGVFLADVFIRRVAIGTDWVVPAFQWIRTRMIGDRSRVQVQERLEQLQKKKAEVARDLDQRRAATRFEPQADPRNADQATAELTEMLEDIARPAAGKQHPRSERAARDESDAESYTARLLEAKKKARQQRDKR